MLVRAITIPERDIPEAAFRCRARISKKCAAIKLKASCGIVDPKEDRDEVAFEKKKLRFQPFTPEYVVIRYAEWKSGFSRIGCVL